jgi:hypothetical protein
MAKKTKRRTSNKNTTGSASQANTPARRNNQPERTTLFVASTDPRVTTCEAWKSAMQFRHELLTNPRQDSGTSGYWSVWVGTLQRWLYGGGNWGDGYYAPGHRITTPDAAVSLKSIKETRNDLVRNEKNFRHKDKPEPGDDERTMFFPTGATYWHTGPVIDWNQLFPAIEDRAPLVEWLESWIDRITFTEATGHYPWEQVTNRNDDDDPATILVKLLDAKIARETIPDPVTEQAVSVTEPAGNDAPPADDMRELGWFTAATNEGLKAEAMRQALNRPNSTKPKKWRAIKQGKRWFVSAMAVANDELCHPYRHMILSQLERDKTSAFYRRNTDPA